MEPKEAARILWHLAEGRDIATGEPLPPQSQYHNPEAIRALFTAARFLESYREAPPKAGGPWSPEEEARLIQAFDEGKTIKEIGADHERTPGAIRSRLLKLGKIDAPPAKSDAASQLPANPKPNDDIPF